MEGVKAKGLNSLCATFLLAGTWQMLADASATEMCLWVLERKGRNGMLSSSDPSPLLQRTYQPLPLGTLAHQSHSSLWVCTELPWALLQLPEHSLVMFALFPLFYKAEADQGAPCKQDRVLDFYVQRAGLGNARISKSGVVGETKRFWQIQDQKSLEWNYSYPDLLRRVIFL